MQAALLCNGTPLAFHIIILNGNNHLTTKYDTILIIMRFQLAHSTMNSLNSDTEYHEFLKEGHDKVRKTYIEEFRKINTSCHMASLLVRNEFKKFTML